MIMEDEIWKGMNMKCNGMKECKIWEASCACIPKLDYLEKEISYPTLPLMMYDVLRNRCFSWTLSRLIGASLIGKYWNLVIGYGEKLDKDH